ncbi:MAG: enoyl-CoA hydratase-related protein, partial [Halieaceae bacterium]|nr:enoyl-CoA hydratase-related protein [Halieaceae bacterium]
MTTLVEITDFDDFTSIVMDDGKANALSFDMLSALNAALDQAEAAGKCIVLAGRPGRFSAGFDLTVMAKQDADTLRLLRSGADLALRLFDAPVPVVGAVSGHAIAMGALL